MTDDDTFQTALRSAIDAGGGIVTFSEAMGVTHQAVYNWKGQGWVPLERATDIQRIWGIPFTALVKPSVARALDMTTTADDLL